MKTFPLSLLAIVLMVLTPIAFVITLQRSTESLGRTKVVIANGGTYQCEWTQTTFVDLVCYDGGGKRLFMTGAWNVEAVTPMP